jgi:hypothetical protein
MNKLYIYHHLGLGDHIICNAIVRNYAKQNDIILFVKPHNYENVKFMYRDLKNIDYVIGDDSIAEKYIKDNNITNLLKIGFDELDRSVNFDLSFYRLAKIDFEKKWTDFYIDRDKKKEKELFNSLEIKENEYIFINEDKTKGYKLNENKYRHDIPIITSEMSCGLFDLCYTVENALEIHLMESSIKCLSDHINIKTDKLFYHSYVRNYPKTLRVTSRRNWTIL